jgi:hypothetical protein
VIGSAVAGAILLTPLIVWERRTSDPLIPLLLFEKWSFACGNLVSLLANIILFGLFFLMPFTFERVFGETAFSGGLRLTNISLALGLMATLRPIHLTSNLSKIESHRTAAQTDRCQRIPMRSGIFPRRVEGHIVVNAAGNAKPRSQCDGKRPPLH